MALDITVFGNVDWGKFNGVAHADTQTYPNDDNIHLLSDIFTIPDNIKDGRRYNVVITFEGDVVIGKKIVETTTDDQGNTVTTEKLVGKIYVPAKNPVSLSSDYILSTVFGQSTIAFQNISSTPADTKPEFEVNIMIISPDPML